MELDWQYTWKAFGFKKSLTSAMLIKGHLQDWLLCVSHVLTLLSQSKNAVIVKKIDYSDLLRSSLKRRRKSCGISGVLVDRKNWGFHEDLELDLLVHNWQMDTKIYYLKAEVLSRGWHDSVFAGVIFLFNFSLKFPHSPTPSSHPAISIRGKLRASCQMQGDLRVHFRRRTRSAICRQKHLSRASEGFLAWHWTWTEFHPNWRHLRTEMARRGVRTQARLISTN